jgi:hypothetical protein
LIALFRTNTNSKGLALFAALLLVAIMMVWAEPKSPRTEAHATVVGGCSTTITDNFGGGAGTSGDPFLICNRSQLALVVSDSNTRSKNYLLKQDIDLGGSSTPWIPLTGGFDGVLDGGDFTIKNLFVSSTANRVGLFQTVAGATIRKLRFENPTIISSSVGDLPSGVSTDGSGTWPAAGVIAGTGNLNTISEIVITGAQISGNIITGGFVIGEMYTGGSSSNFNLIKISSSSLSTNRDYASDTYLGGIVGGSRAAAFNRVSVQGTITQSPTGDGGPMGGIVGKSWATITVGQSNLDVVLNANSSYTNAGGVYGQGGADVSNTIFRGTISNPGSTSYLGGFAAYHTTAITNFLSTATIPFGGTTNQRGPIVGQSLTSSTAAPSVFYISETHASFTGRYGTPTSSADLKRISTYADAGWSISEDTSRAVTTDWELSDSTDPIFKISEGSSYPTLVWMDYWPGPAATSEAPPTSGGSSGGGSAVPLPIVVEPVVVEVKTTNTRFINFPGNSSSLPAAARKGIKKRIASFEAVNQVVCTGYTSGTTSNSNARALARQRAKAACDVAQRLAPASEVRIKVSPAAGIGSKFRSVRVKITGS